MKIPFAQIWKTVINPLTWMVPATVILVFFLYLSGLVDFHELDTVDLRFRLRGHQPANTNLVLVTIDDDSLAALGAWPWPRRTYAVFLDVLSRCDPRAIFFDILFTENGPNAEDDAMLQTAIQKTGCVVLPFFYGSENPFKAMFPIEKLRNAANAIGYINAAIDSDGQTRRIKTFLETPDGTFYNAAVPTVAMGMMEKEDWKPWLENLPTDREHHLWINFPGPWDSFDHISFREVMEAAISGQNEELKSRFEGRIVLVAHTATGTSLMDVKPTPFGASEPGIVILASTVHTLLSGRMLRSIPPALHFFLLALLAGLIQFLTKKFNPKKSLGIILGVAVIYALINYLAFVFLGWILPVVVPITVIVLTYFMLIMTKFIEFYIQREVVERELAAAAQIQSGFLPSSLPESKYLDIAVECQFNKTVGGDLYSWVDFGKDRLGFCVGDVSGKGIPASIYMSKAMSDFGSLPKSNMTAGKLCSELNRVLTASGISNMFLTLLYVMVDLHQRKIFFANGGHEPMLFYNSRTQEVEIVEGESGMPLGIFAEADYATNTHPFNEGDSFLLISDGVRESRNPKYEEFGIPRLKATLEKYARCQLHAKQILLSILQEMKDFQQGTLPHDDRTFLYVEFLDLQK